MFFGACGQQRPPAASAVFDEVEGEFIAGNLSRASATAEQAVARLAATDPLWTSRFRLELAKIRLYQGKSSDVVELLQAQPATPALVHAAMLEAAPGTWPGGPAMERDLLLAVAYSRLGDKTHSDAALLDAHRLCRDPARCPALGSVEGLLALQRGAFAEAEHDFQLCLETAQQGEDKFLTAEATLNLGTSLLEQEHYEDALAQLRTASALAADLGARLVEEKAQGSIGWAYFKTGDFRRALDSYRQAEAQAKDIGAPIDEVSWGNTAGLSQYRLGDYVAARAAFEHSLQLAQAIHDHEQTLDSHMALSYLLLQTGDLGAAGAHIEQAKELSAQQADQSLEPALLDALFTARTGDQAGAITKLKWLLSRKTELVPSLQWEAENRLADLYAQTGRDAEADAWFRQAITTFHLQRSSLNDVESQLPFLENGTGLYNCYIQHLLSEHKSRLALSVLDDSRSQALAGGLTPPGPERMQKLPDIEAIARRVQATILVYSLQPHTSYLWAANDKQEKFYLLAGKEEILPLVESQKRAILASRDMLSGEGQTAAHALFDKLVEPALELIPPGGRVFIVSDSELSGLNFETLLTPGERAHYWIEDVTLTNALSLRLLASSAVHTQPKSAPKLLLIGDPVYPAGDFAPLSNASQEVAEVAGRFTPAARTVLTGQSASPVSYKNSLPAQFSYIHFVAHATANENSPLDSAVILSSAANEGQRLYARDILEYPLHADLVTLSTCYGSGRRSYAGEGLVGLAWAFLRAGSHHVISATWEVSDVATPQLMDVLYARMAAGEPPDIALRSAKLSMLKTSGVFRKPLYWASFQLYSGA